MDAIEIGTYITLLGDHMSNIAPDGMVTSLFLPLDKMHEEIEIWKDGK